MARNSRQRYQKAVLAVEDALTLSRDLNAAGLSSAITLCTELLTDYAAHVASWHATTGEEHKALHTAGQLASAVAPYDLTSLLARTNDLQTKYALHNTDAAAASPTYHIADVGAGNALADATAVTTLAGAITKLNDIKAKYNSHDADTTGHRTGGLHQIAAADGALGVAVKVITGMADVKLGDRVSWAILNDGTGNVTGVSAVANDGSVTFTFSADPQDAIISYCVCSAG